MTGDKDSTAKTPNNNVDRSEKASDELAIVFSVWPAWIARNDGGATPKAEKKKNCRCFKSFGKFLNYLIKNCFEIRLISALRVTVIS